MAARQSQSNNPAQMSFDWTASLPPVAVPASPSRDIRHEHATEQSRALSHPAEPQLPEPPHLVQVLPWDFRTIFPPPLDQAIEAGKLSEEDADPENLKALHEEHAREAMTYLSDLDAITDARRRGVDPCTGTLPRTPKQKARLEKLFAEEPQRLEHGFDVLMDVYEEAFGAEATNAFRKAIRAWHAGIEVISEEMPRNKPFVASVSAGIFGLEEDGSLVNPDEAEIDEIIEQLADKLDNLADGPEREGILAKYAEDFGEVAAKELNRWVRLKSEADGVTRIEYDPGHPWHYYIEGDAGIPMPPEKIPARNVSLDQFGVKWPKDAGKRRKLMEKMLTEQASQLAEDERRYRDLLERGPEALCEYDRQIAHGGNEDLAWASAVALKFNHISFARGRVSCLNGLLGSGNKTTN